MKLATLLAAAAVTPSVLFAQADQEPQAMARVVSERKDDVAWENDLTAYRIYGPPLKNSREKENSGIDVWFKNVRYPVMNKWYADELAGKLSYHKDHGEGYDAFKTADSRGCGGTALWVDGKMVISGVYRTAKILSPGPGEAKFVVTYQYDTPEGPIDEEKTITLKPGDHLFTSRSVFTKGGTPVADLPVAIGLFTQSKNAEVELGKEDGIVSVWDQIDGVDFGMAAVIPPGKVVEMLEQPAGGDHEHALCIVKTDSDGVVEFQAGSVWSKGTDIQSGADWLAFLEKRK